MEEETITRPKPIRLQLGRSSRLKKFGSREEVLAWLAGELQAWGPIMTYAGASPIRRPEQIAGQLIGSALNRLQQLVDQGPGRNGEESYVQNLQEEFSAVYGKPRLFTASSPEGRFILADGSPQAQAARFLALVGHTDRLLNKPETLTGDLLEGYVSGLLYRKRISKDTEQHVNAALDELAKQHDEALSELYQKQDGELSKLLDHRTHALEVLTQSMREAASLLTKQREDEQKEFAGQLAEWRQRQDDWEERLKERLALEAPMDYWSKKAIAHGTKVKHFTIAAVITGIAFGGIFIWFAISVLIGDTLTAGDYVRIVVLVTVATLMMWALRILVRVLLSELHLQSDAREREVILKTYTALDANETSRLSNEDRLLLLAYVFRPASTGIVKDDAAPPGLAELLSRVEPR